MFLFLYLADGAHAVADGMTTATVNEGDVSEAEISHPLFPDQRKSIRHARLTTLGVVALWLFMTLGPDTPLIDEAVSPEAQLTPYYQSLVSGFMTLFLLAGWAYGRATGIIKNRREMVRMMSESKGTWRIYWSLPSVGMLFFLTSIYGHAYCRVLSARRQTLFHGATDGRDYL